MYGIFLRLTHSGATTTSVYVADVEAVPTRVPTKQPGPVYVPVNGYVDLVFTSPVALSYESGNIRRFLNNGLLTSSFVFGDGYSLAEGQVFRQNFVTSPGSTIIESFWLPFPVRVWGIQAYIVIPAVTAGTYLLTIMAQGNPLLTGDFDLTTLAATTVTDIPLTATTADLELPANTPFTIQVASSLGDLVGAGLVVQVLYGPR